MRRGDIVLVAFPFTDLTATKVRPALVVSPAPYHRATQDVLLAGISSMVPARRLLPCEVLIEAKDPTFPFSGLRQSSIVLCGKLFTMEQRLVLRYLGRLAEKAQARVDAALGAALGLSAWR